MVAYLGQHREEIIKVGCGSYIDHNCIQAALDCCLPFDIECFTLKAYKYCHILSLKYLSCYFAGAGVEYSKLLEHENTRCLSLGHIFFPRKVSSFYYTALWEPIKL